MAVESVTRHWRIGVFAGFPAAFLLVAAIEGTPPLFNQGHAPIAVGPAPAGTLGLEAASCGTCHPREYEAWSHSIHARAGTEPLYLASHRHEPGTDCTNCHVPQNATRELANPTTEGVTCVTCHVRDGVVLTANPGADRLRAPHPLRADVRLAGPEACAGCHQFNFGTPETDNREPSDEPMQATLDEHRASPMSATSCQTCHMPEGAHSFPGAHDRDFLRAALHVRADPRPEGVALTLESTKAHATPTGDLFRYLTVKIESVSGTPDPVRIDGSRLTLPATLVLGRVFDTRPELADGRIVNRKRLVEDTRIPAAGAKAVLLEGRAGARFRYEIAYHFVEELVAARFAVPADAHERAYVVTSGEFTVPGRSVP